MFTRFCGFGPGHKSTCYITKVFQDEIMEAFGLGKDDMGDDFEAIPIQPSEHDEESEDESDGDSDLAENGEVDFWDVDFDDLDYLAFEE